MRMSPNENALCALMENAGYSHGLINVALSVAHQSPTAVTDLLLYIDGEHPSEEEFIAYLATLCE